MRVLYAPWGLNHLSIRISIIYPISFYIKENKVLQLIFDDSFAFRMRIYNYYNNFVGYEFFPSKHN
jgi:hypothetical protein